MHATTVRTEQERLLSEFHCLGSWPARYQYIIDQGRTLPTLPAAWRSERDRVIACPSRAWIRGSGDAGCVRFQGSSDCPMDAGLMAIAVRLLAGRAAETIIATPPDFIAALGLPGRMTAQRVQGAYAMVHHMRRIAIRFRLGGAVYPAVRKPPRRAGASRIAG